jgi:hypothetical protein
MMLEILIPTIPERLDKFFPLYDELNRQIFQCAQDHEMLGTVILQINQEKRYLQGGPSIGAKRQMLLESATAKYVAFLDDDETIAPNYIETLLRLCRQDADVCTFRAMLKLKDYWGLVDMRLVHKVNDQATPEHTMRRPPWHICPVRREFAQLYKFNDKNNAEDFEWFEKVLTHCTTEAHTDRILFSYNHGDHSEADRIWTHS